jgi:hypothetical protein
MGALNRETALRIAMTLLDTIKRLRKFNKKFALNTAQSIALYQIADDWTLQSILGGPLYKDEWTFIRMLADRSPFSYELEEGFLQEVSEMEFRTRPGKVLSSALAWATLLDSAVVSFDAQPDWSKAWTDTAFSILEDDGSLSELEGKVRNTSQAAHADEHVEWLKRLGLSDISPASQVWVERAERFPGLRFLQRTEKDLATLEGSGAPFLQALSALEALSNDVANWKPEAPWPDFSTKASPESETRQKLCWVNDEATGKDELCEWHTRFTGGLAGRVHFRVDGASHVIVVAYIGAKLRRCIPG